MTFLHAFAAIAVLGSGAVLAHGPVEQRYRVDEVVTPSTMGDACVPGFQRGSGAGGINDFGGVIGGFSCISLFDPSIPAYNYESGPFVGAPWFGSFELPFSEPGSGFASTINNFGTVFGAEIPSTGGFYGSRWSLAGGRERIFDEPTCLPGLHWSAAIAGNGRYTIGWGFRQDPTLPPELFNLCIATRWLIRNPAGVETVLPFNGTPSSINALHTVVGTRDRSAIRYNIVTTQLRVLHEGDDLHRVETGQINDLGEVAGRIINSSTPGGVSQCDPAVAVRWERDGTEHLLPHLPGAVSSRAYSVGYDGEVVGDSGAGTYCPYAENATEHATLWRGDRAIDLNGLIPRSLGITLTQAAGINRRGQIAVSGIVNSEPAQTCPSYVYDTGVAVLTPLTCRGIHLFVLTPLGR